MTPAAALKIPTPTNQGFVFDCTVVTLTMSFLCVLQKEEVVPAGKEKEVRSKDGGPGLSVALNHEDLYFPSVDLLTAQVHTQSHVLLQRHDATGHPAAVHSPCMPSVF